METRTKLGILVKLDPPQLERLNELAKATRVTRSAYIREGIDLVLTKYAKAAKARRAK